MTENYKIYGRVFAMLLFVIACFLPHITAASMLDTDKDGLTDEEEVKVYLTDPNLPDFDGDGLADGDEVNVFGLSPSKKHTRGDVRFSDGNYIIGGYDVMKIDTKFNPQRLAEISKNLQKFGLHEPTMTTLKSLRHISVNLKGQQLVYGWGNYTAGVFKVSTGLKATPTPSGNFQVQKKLPLVNYIGPDYRYLNVKWNLLFYREKPGMLGFYIHGAYWHNRFGRTNSHGCINVSYKDMPKLYEWAETGDRIAIN
ncbi:MAG TPA: L,D-transpeptidase family protein [Patescibacteria group bacterium]|nr:L,D-transpeptidase family protein [Patescibacteria group bacterium]